MVTQAQFDADTYIRREVVTDALDWLGDEMCRRTGRPRTAAGTKGDRNHLRGAHRSQAFIRYSRLCTNRTYTIQPGLTAEQENQVAGFDFTPGTAADMIAQSRRLMAEMRAGRLEEVREIYCNVDGDKVVDGWDNVANRAATSDSSHLWHWHLTIDRRHLTDTALMARILAIALGQPAPSTTADVPPPPRKDHDDMLMLKLPKNDTVWLSRYWGGQGVQRVALNDGEMPADTPLITVANEARLTLLGGPERTTTG